MKAKCDLFLLDMVMKPLLITALALNMLLPEKPKYNSEWASYLDNVDSAEASIGVDLGLRSIAPAQNFPYVVEIKFKFLHPNNRGFPDSLESEKTWDLYDALNVGPCKNLISAGRITTAGYRVLFYYSSNKNNITDEFSKILNDFGYMDNSITITADSSWQKYWYYLCPDEYQYEIITNENTFKSLLEDGDDFTKSRLVDYSYIFKTDTDRARFKVMMEEFGFKTNHEDFVKDKEFGFGITFQREQIINEAVFNKDYLYFHQLAKENNGEPDGWGCFPVNGK